MVTDVRRNEIKRLFQEGGAGAVVAFVNGFPDRDRPTLYAIAQRVLGRPDPDGTIDLDGYITVARAGIDECLRLAAAATEPDERVALTDHANAMSYDLGADLAACWPGDEAPRERRHFEEGLRAAQDCIRWREALSKPSSGKSMAHWLAGIHRLSLGEHEAARDDFDRSLALAMEAARAEDRSADLGPDAPFAVVLGHGYVTLADMAGGDASARERYDAVLDVFRAQTEGEDDDAREDAHFGIAQLEWVRARALN